MLKILFPASDHSVVLKEIKVPLWTNPRCQSALRHQFGPAYTLPTTAVCAGSEGSDACDVSIKLIRFFLIEKKYNINLKINK